jgi:hypothetical protein
LRYSLDVPREIVNVRNRANSAFFERPTERARFRAFLQDLEVKSSENYDKTLVTVTSAAIGVSLIFLKDIVGDGSLFHVWFLFTAWATWVLALAANLFSFAFSQVGLRKLIRLIDQNAPLNQASPGGFFGRFVPFLNWGAGFLFVLGAGCFLWFVFANVRTT